MKHNHPPKYEMSRRVIAVGSILGAIALGGCTDSAEPCGGEVRAGSHKLLPLGDEKEPVWAGHSTHPEQLRFYAQPFRGHLGSAAIGGKVTVDGVTLEIEKLPNGSLYATCQN